MSSIAPVAPELVIALSALFTLFSDAVFRRRERAGAWIGAVGCLLAAGLSASGGSGLTLFGGQIAVDGAALFARTITLLLATAFFVWLAGAGLRGGGVRQFAALALFGILGALLVISARDWVVLLLALETATMPAYVLMGFERRADRGLEGALKYFLFSMVSSVVFFYGVSFIVGMSGSTSFAATTLQPGAIGLVAAVFVVAGLLAKLSAVPFQWWAPDAYSAAPAASVAFVSSIPKIAGLIAFARVVALLAPQARGLTVVVAGAAVLSMLLGNLAAYPQQDLRRLMAYSGIAHAGYLLVGLAAGTAGGLRAAAFYAVAYAIPSMAIMLIVAGVGVRLDDFKGLASRRPYLAWTMTLLLLSLIGVPPLAGFTGKLFVFTAAISGGLLWVAVLGVALSVVAAGFYLRIVRAMFFSEPVGTPTAPAPSALSVAAILVCAAAVVAVGVMSSPLLSIIAFSPH